jgi:hypothetical protein
MYDISVVPTTTGSEPRATPTEGLCLDCNYPLRGLADPRCPECGRAFDAADARSFNPGKPMPRWMRWWLKPAGRGMLICAALAALALATVPYEEFMAPGVSRFDPSFRVPLTARHVGISHKSVAALIWLTLLLAWSCHAAMRWFIVRHFRQDRALLVGDRRARRLSSAFFLAGIFLAGCGTYDCWHARYFNVWGFGGIAYSEHGGPCYHRAERRAHLAGPIYAFTTYYARPLGLHFDL